MDATRVLRHLEQKEAERRERREKKQRQLAKISETHEESDVASFLPSNHRSPSLKPPDMRSRSVSKASTSYVLTKARRILPHVGLVFATFLYIVFGSLVFYYLESSNEIETKKALVQDANQHQADAIAEIYAKGQTARSKAEFAEAADEVIDRFIQQRAALFKKRLVTPQDLQSNELINTQWSFGATLFFCTIVMTTIGYGNTVPRTPIGRIFCTFFGLFGIPLMLVTTADIGKFITDFIGNAWTRVRALVIAMLRCRKATFVRHKVPSLLMLSILSGFITFGAFLFASPHSMLQSTYLSVITITTIGYGDYLPPLNNNFQVATGVFYILAGLIITTMVIDVVASRYIRNVHYFGRRIQDAKAVLHLLGGNIADLMWNIKLVQRKYGLSDQEVAEMIKENTVKKVEHVLGNVTLVTSRSSYRPHDIDNIDWIDRRSSGTTSARKFAEFEDIFNWEAAFDKESLPL